MRGKKKKKLVAVHYSKLLNFLKLSSSNIACILVFVVLKIAFLAILTPPIWMLRLLQRSQNHIYITMKVWISLDERFNTSYSKLYRWGMHIVQF